MYQQHAKTLIQIPQILSGITSVRASYDIQCRDTESENEIQFNQVLIMQKQLTAIAKSAVSQIQTKILKTEQVNDYVGLFQLLNQNSIQIKKLEKKVQFQHDCINISNQNLSRMTEHSQKLKYYLQKQNERQIKQSHD
ncbi:Hypothetical_protein [Hexamita inflata]|uniref:Hypothetical_protein n=1 Tax=Hexamita inflata TaxID=28002 RepID=A0AA86PHU6_9EUKA|nr:Hypothetical protein HINF_LOCUS23797 [Hexamita inflata]